MNLDTALQREADLTTAHKNELEELRHAHAAAMSGLEAASQARIAAVQTAAEAKQQQCDALVEQYRLAHTAAIAVLTEPPAVRELRLRQAQVAAELAQRQSQELAAVAAKL